MTASELRNMFEHSGNEFEFGYNDKIGAVCPYSPVGLVAGYNGSEITFSSFDELMATPFLDGKSFNEVAEQVTLYG